jgi:[acyl-carrier-protein] S-malonyltransferase
MQKSAFLFPGQGSQAVGMMSGFADAGSAEHRDIARATFAEASAVLGYDLWDLVQTGPEERLGQTEITQPALLTASIAAWRIWQAVGGANPDFMAGHSLGEYSALAAAGAIDFAAAVGLVAERGRRMQAATPPGSGAMAAILGLDDAVLEEVCGRATKELEQESGPGRVVSCANYNSPGQIVIAGDRVAVERACALAAAAGARRAIPLAVSVPSHCALMRPAADALERILADVALAPCRVPVVHNVDVRIHGEADAVRAALARQLWQPVRWSGTIEWLIGAGVVNFAECGPGKVLSGLNRRISRDVVTHALDSHQAVIEAQANWS